VSLLIQDGRRGGHLRWATQAIELGIAGGVTISPFHTPRIAVPHHYAGSRVATDVTAAGGEVIFDPSTHARLLLGSNDLLHYDTWQLWGPAGVGLDTDARRFEHVERVLSRQRELGAESLAPTQTLESPLALEASHALRTAQFARGLERTCWQSLAGRRSFWRSGPDLDSHVGQLASLRAPCWMVTIVNETVVDNAPDMEDTEAFAGLCRTVHSLSQRSRVIVCHSDYAGLPAVAAGAHDVGTGWDRGMRYFDPRSFQRTSPGIQIPASYVTQGGLVAVLRRDAGDAIGRLGDPLATTLRGGPMPADDAAERLHHLRQLDGIVKDIQNHGRSRADRVQTLRSAYDNAITEFNSLLTTLPRRFVNEALRRRWLEQPRRVLEVYARAEGLW
jgi:hypothetical protein